MTTEIEMNEAVVFKDFDATEREVDDRTVPFKLGGRTWDANLSPNAGRLLRWMRQGSKVEAIPGLLEAVLGDDYLVFEQTMIDENVPFPAVEEVLVWLVQQVGGSGN